MKFKLITVYCKHFNFQLLFRLSFSDKMAAPLIKTRSVSEFIEIMERFDVCNKWIIRNRKVKSITFTWKGFRGVLKN